MKKPIQVLLSAMAIMVIIGIWLYRNTELWPQLETLLPPRIVQTIVVTAPVDYDKSFTDLMDPSRFKWSWENYRWKTGDPEVQALIQELDQKYEDSNGPAIRFLQGMTGGLNPRKGKKTVEFSLIAFNRRMTTAEVIKHFSQLNLDAANGKELLSLGTVHASQNFFPKGYKLTAGNSFKLPLLVALSPVDVEDARIFDGSPKVLGLLAWPDSEHAVANPPYTMSLLSSSSSLEETIWGKGTWFVAAKIWPPEYSR